MKLKITFLLLLTTPLLGCHNSPTSSCAKQAIQTATQAANSTITTQPLAATTTASDDNEPSIATAPPGTPADNTAAIKQLKVAPVAPVAKIISTPTPQVQPEQTTSKNAVAPIIDIWQPNEAQIARGNELILGLKGEMNREPTKHEMQKRLQTHMGLTPTQAQKIITALQISPDLE